MSTEPPNQPPPGSPYGGSPYGSPPPGGEGGPYGAGGPRGPYDKGPGEQGPYGPHPGGRDPMEGMPPLAAGGKRVLARIIDIIVVVVPAGLLDWAAGGLRDGDFDTGRSAVGGLFTAGLGFLYEWYMTRSDGRTIGKRVTKLRAAVLEDGGIPSSSSAAIRAAVLWLPAFFCSCFWFLIIGVTVSFDRPYKQGIHDKAAKTVVVESA